MKDDSWLRRKAEEEDGQCVSVGGLVEELENQFAITVSDSVISKIQIAAETVLNRRLMSNELADFIEEEIQYWLGTREWSESLPNSISSWNNKNKSSKRSV